MNEEKKLMIFNIQRYSLHDGAGIRTVVFLKGCPLRCLWCCNPESQSFDKELIYRKTRCIGMEHCGLCRKAEPGEETGTKNNFPGIRTGSDGKALPDMERCRGALGLAKVCPAKAFEVEGREISVDEIMDIVRHDEVFYRGKGGLTLSGGEPLVQEGSIELLKRAKEEYVHTAVESCGYVPEDRLLRAAEYLDEIFFDVKSVNDEKHIRYTGVSNQQILSNLNSLKKAFPKKKIRVRTPVIPGFNSTEEDLCAIEGYLVSLGITDWEKLPYHTYGVGKYEMLGREYPLPRED